MDGQEKLLMVERLTEMDEAGKMFLLGYMAGRMALPEFQRGMTDGAAEMQAERKAS